MTDGTAEPTGAARPRLLAVCAGPLAEVGRGRAAHLSGIDKRPLDGPVHVDAGGVPGDRVGDVANHGGVDQALYAYAQEDAEAWEERLGRARPPGAFGENLRTLGVATTGARIGERWRLGAQVEVEVTAPRIPCATLAAHWDEPGIVAAFLREGRLGCYLRVVTGGPLAAGDPIARVAEAPAGAPTVAEVAVVLTRERHRAAELLEVPGIAHRLRDWAAEVTVARG